MIDNRTKILIVDDDLTSRRLMEKVIYLQWKCNLLLADDGSEALKIMLKEHPSLVILDLVMPFMNGIQVLQTHAQKSQARQNECIGLYSG